MVWVSVAPWAGNVVVLAFVWVMQRVFTKIEKKKKKTSTVIADLLLLLLLLLAPVSATTQVRQVN